jgi:class 3 adenylate cyclase
VFAPRQVAEVVGRHLAAMVEVGTAHGGVLDKFAGDAVMAVFGAPRPVADHARRALVCAAAMQRRQLALNQAAEHAVLPAFQIGVGLNTGTVIAGTLGGPGRLDYTVLGDAVNIAQRLQSEAIGGEILAAAITVRQAGTKLAESVGPSSSRDARSRSMCTASAGWMCRRRSKRARPLTPNDPRRPPSKVRTRLPPRSLAHASGSNT